MAEERVWKFEMTSDNGDIIKFEFSKNGKEKFNFTENTIVEKKILEKIDKFITTFLEIDICCNGINDIEINKL